QYIRDFDNLDRRVAVILPKRVQEVVVIMSSNGTTPIGILDSKHYEWNLFEIASARTLLTLEFNLTTPLTLIANVTYNILIPECDIISIPLAVISRRVMVDIQLN